MARAHYQRPNPNIPCGVNTRHRALEALEQNDVKRAIASLHRALDAKKDAVAEVNISEAFRLCRDILRSRLNG